MQPVVIDTNIVLDMWVFDDPRSRPLHQALQSGGLRWLASAEMREELLRVLGYPHLVARQALRGVSASEVLVQFDRHAELVASAERAPYVCNDADDQKFIDLAVAHQATLISKDKEVLRMKNRLARLGVAVLPVWVPPV
jgi:putative PIN family toxin of toxin-antitoxin system